MNKKILSYIILLLVLPSIIVTGAILFDDKQYAWIFLCLVVVACSIFFMRYENSKADSNQMIIIAVMVSLSVIGRIIFTPLPGFKPVTAITVITAMYFGKEIGFMTGALSALISNFYFGQGPWTPFQMFSWGIIGLLAALFAKYLKKNKIFIIIFGVASGIIYSLTMDIWTVLWIDGSFNLSRYLAAIISASQVMVVYSVSNVVFLLLLAKPIGKKLDRIKIKYGL